MDFIEAKRVTLRQLEPGRTYSIAHFDPVECMGNDPAPSVVDIKGEARLPAPDHSHDLVILLKLVT